MKTIFVSSLLVKHLQENIASGEFSKMHHKFCEYSFEPLHPNQLSLCVPSSQLSSNFPIQLKDSIDAGRALAGFVSAMQPYHRYHLPIQQDQEDCQQSQGDCCTIHFYRSKCREIYRLHFSPLQLQPRVVCAGESLCKS